MSSSPARIKIQLKMKALVCLQDSFNYKFLGIFPDAQGQLTLQSMARSGRMSSLSAENEEVPIKNEGARTATR